METENPRHKHPRDTISTVCCWKAARQVVDPKADNKLGNLLTLIVVNKDGCSSQQLQINRVRHLQIATVNNVHEQEEIFGIPFRCGQLVTHLAISANLDTDEKTKYVEQRARGTYIASVCQPEAAYDLAVAAQAQNPEPTDCHEMAVNTDIAKPNKRIQWQMDNPDRGLKYISPQLPTAKFFVFVDGSFANNKDQSSQIGFVTKRLMCDIMSFRESYEKREIREMRWINGNDNIADALTNEVPNKALEKFVSNNEMKIRVEGWVDRGKTARMNVRVISVAMGVFLLFLRSIDKHDVFCY